MALEAPLSGSHPPLQLALVVPRTHAEGPGLRFALWVQGCPLHCPGCCNPELWPFAGGQETPLETLLADIRQANVEGISLLGGEPFAQAAALSCLAQQVQALGLSVVTFTGYTLLELRQRQDPNVDRLLAHTDLLIDGPYQAAQRTLTRRWVGSSNQVLHFLTPRYHPEDPCFTEPNHLEIRYGKHGITVNGFPAGALLFRPEPEVTPR